MIYIATVEVGCSPFKYYIGKLVVMAYGQEYLKTGKRAKRVQAALNRATHIIPCSIYHEND